MDYHWIGRWNERGRLEEMVWGRESRLSVALRRRINPR